MSTLRKFQITVNGVVQHVEVDRNTPLLTVLRNDLRLNGPKFGCGLGECGACTVIIDGLAARSCVIPISLAEGRETLTLEGLANGKTPDLIQQSFIEAQAAQCGYCLNGMVLTAKAFLDRNPTPTEAEIRNAHARDTWTHQSINALNAIRTMCASRPQIIR